MDVIDELLSMAEMDPEEIKYIRQNVPAEVSQKFDDEQLQYIVDVTFEYLDSKDENDDIIVDDVAQYVVAQAHQQEVGDFSVDDVSEVVDADLDYLETVA